MIRTDVCAGCGGEFEQEIKQGRPRTFCFSCRPVTEKDDPGPLAGLKPDPPLRADGRCASCEKPRRVTKQSRQYAGVQVDLDPFCSTECCRRFHGCELRVNVEKSRGGRVAQERRREQAGLSSPYDDLLELAGP